MKKLIRYLKNLFKKKKVLPKKNYTDEIDWLLEPDEDQIILDPHELKISQ